MIAGEDPRPLLDLEAASARPFGLGRGWAAPALAGLSVLEVFVLWRRGHVAGLTFSLAEVGALLGCSGERARQIEAEALARLARRLELAELWRCLGEEPADASVAGSLVA